MARLIWPVGPNRSDGTYTFTDFQDFGPRTGGGSSFHKGLDFARSGNPNILAVAAGRVVGRFTNLDKRVGYGYSILVDHGAYQTRYAHFQAPAYFQAGDQVAQGTVLGRMGTTGSSTGDHLHLEVLVDGQQIDPQAFIRSGLSEPPAVAPIHKDREEMYLIRNLTGEVAVFGSDYRTAVGGASGRHSFSSLAEYQGWREIVRFHNEQIDSQGLDSRGKLFLPPADVRDIVGVSEANWAIVSALHGV
ncbi:MULTISPECIES: M23 family metallopeptidase [Clavibacter]|uniref:M23 family metallopeptidase n=1 Tax=Clavibacter TaxID=1573 RepID=UPI001BE072C3|nr:M23 family metallopeptidase [Clavibacter michiganensis]MBT1634722.1 M23 family metallopeptidase [Clavibacter michiganensis]